MRFFEAKSVYWISSFFAGTVLSIVFAANQLYRVQTVGLDALQLVLVGTTLEVTAFFFEVPTGIIADLYSRKLSVIIGTFLFGIGFLIEASVPLFGVVLFAQVIWGTGWTFISGAHSAWIADEVGVENVGAVYLRASQLHQVGNLAGIPLFIWLANISYRTPIMVGGVLFLCLGVFRWLSMPERGFKAVERSELKTWQSIGITFRDGIGVARSKPALFTFAMIAVFVGLYSEGYDRLSEAHFIQQFVFPNLPIGDDPIVSWFAVMRLLGTGLSLWATQLVKTKLDLANNLRVTRFLQLLYLFITSGLFAFAWTGNFYLAVASTLLIDTSRSLTEPLIDTWINQYIESRVRATMLSMASQLDSFGQVMGGPFVGLVGTLKNIRFALSTSAILIIPVIPLYHQAIIKERAKTSATDLNS